ncbi:MAG: putative protein N(5)-glutamine methyltransferase [Marmoricola sp.]
MQPEVDPLVARLRAAGCVFAEDEARLLREAASADPTEDPAEDPAVGAAALEDLVRRRIDGEPLEHLVGHVDLGGHRYRVAPGVFVPRQRSLLLVREAVRLAAALPRPPLVLDLCCGCGALGLAVHRACGGRLHASDIDPVAVACARRNGAQHTSVGDLFTPVPRSLRGAVDLLLVNAPYVPSEAIASMPPEARLHEPRHALDGGSDGLAVQHRVLGQAADWLAPGGHLLTETSQVQAEALVRLATAAGWRCSVVRDADLGATALVATPPCTGARRSPGGRQGRGVDQLGRCSGPVEAQNRTFRAQLAVPVAVWTGDPQTLDIRTTRRMGGDHGWPSTHPARD